jgi:hypothetical protein
MSIKITIDIDGFKKQIENFKESVNAGISVVMRDLCTEGRDGSLVDVMKKYAQEIVYDVYSPTMYERGGEVSGILSRIEGEKGEGHSAYVYVWGVEGESINETPNGEPYLMRVILGHNEIPYKYPVEGAAFMPPRDFFTPTQHYAESSVKDGYIKYKLIKAINNAKTAL